MDEYSIIFLGSKQAGLNVCRALIDKLHSGILKAIISPDDSNDQRSEVQQLRTLALTNGIPFHVVKNVAETKEVLKRYNPTVALVHGWYQILPVAEFGATLFLGFHYSPLPKYRGNAPLVWQIINGEKEIGVSFFQLTPGMDEGDLVGQRFFPLAREENIADALVKADELAQAMLFAFLEEWPAKKIKLVRQPNVQPSYCGLRLPEDGRIDWRSSSEKVHDFIRAQSSPYPGAFSLLPDGRKITILSSAVENRNFYGVTGSVVEVSSNDVVIACGSGAVRLKRIMIDDNQVEIPKNLLKSLRIRLT